jgi:hypothetical protein
VSRSNALAMLAAIFGFWDLVLPASKRFRP